MKIYLMPTYCMDVANFSNKFIFTCSLPHAGLRDLEGYMHAVL